ncbi:MULTISPECIES: hypothetical protein [Bradyrhizobium]|uniref:hypothetical protein n=1 Tax=Bradyrhizobium TaxID=374 RepID=UPI001EDA2B44|nr:hypothetical protein [Bradyrhizobium zhengyangense]MCG2642444.1 hypothetical protein [Bradyrhizobium zhengyangense]
MTTAPQPGAREAFKLLRSVCKNFQERLMLGEAIRQGWTASGIEAEARRYSGKGDLKYRIAIQDASKRRYYSPDEQAADQARLKELEDAEAARAAIKATRATRPNVPPEFNVIRAACRSMLDCDRLSAALEAEWSAADINYLARQFSEVACGVEMKETPSAIRFTLEMIQGKPGGQLSPYLPRRNKAP